MAHSRRLSRLPLEKGFRVIVPHFCVVTRAENLQTAGAALIVGQFVARFPRLIVISWGVKGSKLINNISLYYTVVNLMEVYKGLSPRGRRL